MNTKSSVFLGCVLSGVFGCASELEIVSQVTPQTAVKANGKMVAEYIVRDGDKIELPENVRVTQTGYTTEADGSRQALRDGDVVITNTKGQIVEIRGLNGRKVTFLPGSASMQGSFVVGKALGHKDTNVVPFEANDKIQLRGTFNVGDEVPIGGRIETKRNVPLILIGTGLFAASYIPSLIVSQNSPISADKRFAIPFVGPWLNLANRPTCIAEGDTDPLGKLQGSPPCKSEYFARVGVVISGAVQALSLLVVGFGVAEQAVWTGPGEVSKKSAQKNAFQIGVYPSLGLESVGGGVYGSF